MKNKIKIKEENEIINFIKIVIILTVILGLVYALSFFISKKVNKKQVNNIQYEEIIIGEIPNYKGTYYVLVYNEKEHNVEEIKYYLNKYISSNSLKLYTSKLESLFNKNNINDTSLLLTEKIEDIKLSTITLFKCLDGKIIEAYEGNEKILSYAKTL